MRLSHSLSQILRLCCGAGLRCTKPSSSSSHGCHARHHGNVPPALSHPSPACLAPFLSSLLRHARLLFDPRPSPPISSPHLYPALGFAASRPFRQERQERHECARREEGRRRDAAGARDVSRRAQGVRGGMRQTGGSGAGLLGGLFMEFARFRDAVLVGVRRRRIGTSVLPLGEGFWSSRILYWKGLFLCTALFSSILSR